MKRFIPIAIVLILLCITQLVVQAQDPDLEGYWTLDEASGQRSDSSGNGNHLADYNTVGSASGQVNGAADFEANNAEYLAISDASQVGLDITGNLTIAAWIRTESSHDGMIVAKYVSSGNNRSYALYVSTDEAIKCYLSPDGSSVTQAYTANGVITTGSWTHVACVYDGSSITVYIDGEVASNGANNPRSYSGGIANRSADFNIGAWNNGASVYFDGRLDEVRVYSRALSGSEINDLMNGTPTPTSTSTPTPTGTITPTPGGPTPTSTPDTVITNTLSSGNVWALRREVSYGQAAIVTVIIILIGIRIVPILGGKQ